MPARKFKSRGKYVQIQALIKTWDTGSSISRCRAADNILLLLHASSGFDRGLSLTVFTTLAPKQLHVLDKLLGYIIP